MVRTVNALKARRGLGQLLEQVYYKGDQYVIERAGRAMAAVVPVWQLKAWQTRRERFLGLIDELGKKSRKVKPEVIEREVAEAVQAVRASARRPKARSGRGTPPAVIAACTAFGASGALPSLPIF
jgi:antitoxin (DNA-binding transcriptional repressor) of toxin-antitoxin stability system